MRPFCMLMRQFTDNFDTRMRTVRKCKGRPLVTWHCLTVLPNEGATPGVAEVDPDVVERLCGEVHVTELIP
jgi:hypothetical protein